MLLMVDALERRDLMAFTALDPTFGTGGLVVASGTSPLLTSAVAVQPDGKLVIAGTSLVSGAGNELAVRRYNADGTLDATFDADGQTPGEFRDLLSNGRIPIGTPPPSQVVIQPDGKIVVAAVLDANGTSGAKLTDVIRLDADGTLDTTFGSGGEASLASSTLDVSVPLLTLEGDGKIVLAGSTRVTSSTNPATYAAAVRLDADGTLRHHIRGRRDLDVRLRPRSRRGDRDLGGDRPDRQDRPGGVVRKFSRSKSCRSPC